MSPESHSSLVMVGFERVTVANVSQLGILLIFKFSVTENLEARVRSNPSGRLILRNLLIYQTAIQRKTTLRDAHRRTALAVVWQLLRDDASDATPARFYLLLDTTTYVVEYDHNVWSSF